MRENQNYKKPRLFIDMDGTLYAFADEHTCEMYNKGFFANLPLNVTIAEAIHALAKEYELFILSAILTDSKFALKEKKQALKRDFPEISESHYIFVPCGYDKRQAIKDYDIQTDILIDDYTPNFRNWKGEYIKVSRDDMDRMKELQSHRFCISPEMSAEAILFTIRHAAFCAGMEIEYAGNKLNKCSIY